MEKLLLPTDEFQMIFSDFLDHTTDAMQQLNEQLKVESDMRKKSELEAEQSKSRMKDILNSITDSFIVIDENWTILFINDAISNQLSAKALGLGGSDAFIGRNYWQTVPAYLGTPVEENLHAAMERKEIRRWENKSKNTDKWQECVVYPFEGGISVLSVDITERKQHQELEEEMKNQYFKMFLAEKEKNEALKKAIDMKDEFLSLISHEFKTPLTVINSAIQAMRLICKNELSEKANEYLNKILQNSNRQLKLVNNLLDITRANSGHIKIYMENIDIVYMTRSITDSIKVYAEQKGIGLLFSSTMQEKIIGIDAEKYERILLNLLSNAVKFTPGGKSITIRIFQKTINGKRKVCIQIKDQGIGIPQDKQKVIFEKFGQVDSSLSRQAEGTGIGLSLVKLFVELLEGEILLKSREGRGSTFTVLLPVRKVYETPIEKMLQEITDTRLIKATAIEFSDI